MHYGILLPVTISSVSSQICRVASFYTLRQSSGTVQTNPKTSETVPIVTTSQDARRRFIESMTMTFDMWHDGTGYDLEALRSIPEEDIPSLEALLISHQPRDWRDIEALGVLNTPTALIAIQEALSDPDPEVRRQAALYAGPEEDSERERLLLEALKKEVFFGGLSAALDEAEKFHPPRVIETLLDGALNRTGEVAVHFAAMLYFLHGKSNSAFDMEHRPFFLRFHRTDREERLTAFRELCGEIGVDHHRYSCTL